MTDFLLNRKDGKLEIQGPQKPWDWCPLGKSTGALLTQNNKLEHRKKKERKKVEIKYSKVLGIAYKEVKAPIYIYIRL